MRRIVLGFGLAIVLLVPVAAGALSPKVVVNPSGGLVDGQVVRVRATHETPSSTYIAAECDANFPTNGSHDCESIRITGSDSTLYKFKGHVHTGPIGSDAIGGTCGTSAADNNCVVAVMPYNPGNGFWDIAHAVTVPISFALPG